MTRRTQRRFTRRGFLGGAVVGVTGLWIVDRRRGEALRDGTRLRTGATRPASPWTSLREEVTSVDALGPADDELAG